LTLTLEGQKDVWVYGSGTFAIAMISNLEELGFSVNGVVDHMNLGKRIETGKSEFTVQSITDIVLNPESQIVLAVCNLHGNLRDISSKLSLDVKLTTPVELFQMFSKAGLDCHNYWLSTDFELYTESSLAIQSFRGLLGDDESRELLDSILRYRENGKISDLPAPRPLSEQYLARDLSTPPQNLRIIDLGACQGENLVDFIDAGHSFIGGYLFEPDETNLGKLKNRLLELELKSLECYPFGAWNETTTLRFQASGTAAAALSTVGEDSVDVVALDEFIPSGFIPNFIKMDIEGAEMEALAGMVTLIRNHRPHLAISVYHKPSDLWTIGNFLDQNFPGFYKYYLRMYGEQTFDTLLYAVPID
jgi:FkbM family methyltransferase